MKRAGQMVRSFWLMTNSVPADYYEKPLPATESGICRYIVG